MGEIFNALEVLNRTMKLGLSHTEVLRAEMGFKSALAKRGNPDPTLVLPDDPVALTEGYELVATLRPRAERLSLQQLSTLARREMTRPATRVDARAFKQIDGALAAVATKPTRGTAKATAAPPAKKSTAKKSTAAAAKKSPAARKSPAAKKSGTAAKARKGAAGRKA
jgi:hypothetical protein